MNALKMVWKLMQPKIVTLTFGTISRICSVPVVAIPPAFSRRNAIGAAS